MAVGDWASRHDRYANPLHGRLKDGTVAPMSWHCEDASLNWSAIPKVREEWTAIAQRYIDKYGIFDNWGMYCYTNASYKPWGDYLTEIDIGIWEEKLDDETWAGWVDFKSEIAKVIAQVRRLDHRLPRQHAEPATPSWSPKRWAAAGT